jgi:hypothetical protein
LEAGEYSRHLLSDLVSESGDLGQLARMLDAMAHDVALRDHQLRLLRKVIPDRGFAFGGKGFQPPA